MQGYPLLPWGGGGEVEVGRWLETYKKEERNSGEQEEWPACEGME